MTNRSGSASLTGCTSALVALCLLIFGVAAYCQAQTPRKPPDARRTAEAASTVDASARASSSLTGALAFVRGAAPGRPGSVAGAVRDECDVTPEGFMAPRASWSVTCRREAVEYLPFDGDFVRDNRAWDRRLTTALWSGSADMEHAFTYLPGRRPGELPPVSYTRGEISLRIGWLDRRTPLGTPPPPVPVEYVREDRRPDPAAVGRALARHRYVAVVTVSSVYLRGGPGTG